MAVYTYIKDKCRGMFITAALKLSCRYKAKCVEFTLVVQ